MSQDRQLNLVAGWERDKEQKAARDLQQAEQHWQLQKNKLASLQAYRNTYLNDLNKRGATGLEAKTFNQHHAFLAKLDKACEEQLRQISRARLVADQRRNMWLQQQKKRKAVETLLDRKAHERLLKEQRIEQALLDEIATQRFVRRQV